MTDDRNPHPDQPLSEPAAPTTGIDWRKRTDTRRLHAVDADAISPQDQVRQVQQRFDELEGQIREYQAQMRQRGIGLPSAVQQALRAAAADLDELLTEVTASAIELRQLRALAETTALFHSAHSLDSVLEQVMDTVIQLTGAERGFILLRDDRGDLQFKIARGIDREQLSRDDFIISRTIINEVVQTRTPVRTENARSDPRYAGHESIVGYQLRSILAVPLMVLSDLIGVVYCDNRVLTGLFRDYELNLLTAFANQAAVAIHNARLFEQARAHLTAVTELRNLMDGVFTSIASGLIALDPADIITAFNPAAEQITGVAVMAAVGQPLARALPDFSARFREQIMAARAGYSSAQETAVTLPDGRQRIWSLRFTPLRDETAARQHFYNPPSPDQDDNTAPASLGVTIVLDDLTEQRAREAQLAQVRQYLPPALVEHIRSEDLAALGGVERQITCLFADVRGFTSFSERLQPEDLMRIVNRYLTVASDAIHLYEGLVDKYIGDAVTGLFNTQLNPQVDHVVRAVRAALSMSYDVAALHEVLPPEQRLHFGIGIHTGVAVLGNVGSRDRREFAALGDAVDLAKLLQENAGPGVVLLSEATYAFAEPYFECEPVKPTRTRGRADLTVMYRVLGMKRRGH